MNSKCKRGIASFLVLALIAMLCFGCGDDKEKEELTTITIAEITDLTGPASTAVFTLNYALADMVRHYNEEGLIPGVKLRVVTWDTKFDPSRYVPGYDWVRDKGADLIITITPQCTLVLKEFADRDKFPIASLSGHKDMYDPPGWVFSMTSDLAGITTTMLKWISENHWDYSQGIPKTGLAAWSEPIALDMDKRMREYAENHPDKFEYVGGLLPPMGTLTWGHEIEDLKECDYVLAYGLAGASFVELYHDRGYSATFIDPSSWSAMRDYFVDALGYEGLDGTLSAQSAAWWTDSLPIVNLAKDLLNKYRPGQAEDIIYAGLAYVGGTHNLVSTFQILERAIEEVGAENFDGQAYYNAAIKYETGGPLWEGYPQGEFTETKRYLINDMLIYEFSAEAEELVRISDFLPVLSE